MNREEILSHVDHTLLKPEATWPQIQQLCDEAIANHPPLHASKPRCPNCGLSKIEDSFASHNYP